MEASYGACCSVECRLPSIEKTTRRTARPLGVATHLWVPVKVTPSQRLCVTQNVLADWFATVTRAVELVFVPSVAVAVTVNGNVPLPKRFVSTAASYGARFSVATDCPFTLKTTFETVLPVAVAVHGIVPLTD